MYWYTKSTDSEGVVNFYLLLFLFLLDTNLD